MLTRLMLQVAPRRAVSPPTTTAAARATRAAAATTSAPRFRSAAATEEDRATDATAASPLPRWPVPVVASDGDYARDAWLEDLVGGPLYARQAQLPRLPVPDVADTLRRLGPTALPLAKSEAEAQALRAALERFPAQAAALQARLVARREAHPDSSWLQEWWNTHGYLRVRDPVLINVSYFFHFRDDASAGADAVPRAAALLQGAALYRRAVCSGELPPDRVGRPPKETTLCSVAYKYMFHATRIPRLEQDTYELCDPSRHTHAVVVRRGRFYSLPICRPDTGAPLRLAALEDGLRRIVALADADADDDTATPALGWLTSMHRDDWARARADLLERGGGPVQRALERLQSGALLLCLDDEAPVSRGEAAKLFLWGGRRSGGNRWFDKSVQVMVAANGRAGFMGEHSMMDGMPCVGLADAMTRHSYAALRAANHGADDDRCEVAPIFDAEALAALARMANDVTGPWIEKAKQDYHDLVSKHELHVQSFQGYGSDFIKQAGFSPDAFVQMAMQVATYRLWGEQAGTYEATQVRPFLHGRTETTRTVSTESAALVRRMGDRPAMDEHDPEARKEKLALLKAAVDAHVKYIALAAKAQGVDRHLLGLSMLVQDGEPAPDLYADPTFLRAKRWRVSTSHLTHPKFDGWGYGEVVPDGVGLAYSIHPRHCVFNITALREHDWTDKLSYLLEESLLELKTLVEMERASQPVSKL